MKTRLYILIPAAAFALILLNALYGHWAFSASYPEDIAKYSIYVHLQPEWKSHPANLLFDVTNVWDNTGESGEIYYDELSSPPPLDDHNYNRLQSINGRTFVELQHRFSDCQSNWQPILYRYGIDTLRNQFEVAAGATVAGHPYALMYQNHSQGSPDGYNWQEGYVQFVPVCSSHETTSYAYSVRSGDSGTAFDVLFVPAVSEYFKFTRNSSSFEHYPGCSGRSYTSFSGTCDDVSQDAGLLIWIPDELDLALTKITVNLREIPPGPLV